MKSKNPGLPDSRLDPDPELDPDPNPGGKLITDPLDPGLDPQH
jgi:hypothetical protein